MLLLNFLGSQIARYFFVPFITVFLNWFIRILCFPNMIYGYYEWEKPLIGIDLSVSSFLLVLLDISIYLSNNNSIPQDYGANILYASILSLLAIFSIILILKGHHNKDKGTFTRRVITVVIGICSIILSYTFMKI